MALWSAVRGGARSAPHAAQNRAGLEAGGGGPNRFRRARCCLLSPRTTVLPRFAPLSNQIVGTRSRRHSSASTHASILSVLQASGARPLTRCASATSTSHPASSSWSWTNRAPFIDSMAARIGSPCRARRRARPRRPSASGGACVISMASPFSRRRWTSRRFLLRSKPAYNMSGGLLVAWAHLTPHRSPLWWPLFMTFLEEVGPVERLVGLLDGGELRLLARGQVLGVLPEREAGVLELAGDGGLAAPPGRVPDLATDLVEGLAGPLADVEGVQAEGGVLAAFADHDPDPLSGVGTHQSDGPATVLPQLVEEHGERLLVPADRCPDQPVAVVVDDHDQVAVAAFVADLVDPDPPQPRETIHLGLGVAAHAGDDPAHHPPADPEQLGDRRLGGPHRQPGDGVVEGAGVPSGVASHAPRPPPPRARSSGPGAPPS